LFNQEICLRGTARRELIWTETRSKQVRILRHALKFCRRAKMGHGRLHGRCVAPLASSQPPDTGMLGAVGTLAGSLGIGAVVFVGVSFLELKRCALPISPHVDSDGLLHFRHRLFCDTVGHILCACFWKNTSSAVNRWCFLWLCSPVLQVKL
jgi:hypothetical protein